MQYFFILGRQPELSKSEILAKFHQLNIEAKEILSTNDFQIFDVDNEIDVTAFMNQLGGTIKIGKIISELKNVNVDSLLPLIPESDAKIHFGLSTYGCNLKIGNIGKGLKMKLKSKELKARFVSSKDNPLSSVIVKKNHLLDKGIEIVVMKDYEKYIIGQTLEVQPFEQMSKLDYGRPARDDESGMIPPKLAQIMINLSETPIDGTVLDPFCGSGTIIQQALLLGYKNVIGSDSSEKAILDSKENLAWLGKKIEKKLKYKLFIAKSTNVTKEVEPDSIDAIVTEPYLGPPLKGSESKDELKRIMVSLAELYKNTFKTLKYVLKETGTIVIIMPILKTRTQDYKIEMPKVLPDGLKIEKSWEYSRPGQRVIRKIYKITKHS
jgi:tRNA G10  N-methylase Trm11